MIPQHDALVQRMIVAGQLSSPWRSAFRTVPRELFIPDLIWDEVGDELMPVRRADEPGRWQALVYTDDAVITQVEDGRDLGGAAPWLISSSSSAPGIVAMMLHRLDVEPHHRVLEIGTGTGWNAALLAARLGDEQVISLEVDPQIADAARKSLADAGCTVRVITRDGALGYPAGAPYDRVLATAAVQRVPYAWVTQTNPGGRVLTPWGTALDNGALLELTVHDDGSASGTFAEPWVGFMWLRAHRSAAGAVEDVVEEGHAFQERMSPLHPYYAVGDDEARFAVGLRVPRCKVVTVADADGEPNHLVTYLLDPQGGSWASVHVEPHMLDEVPVRQHGPRRLWDEVEMAHGWWVQHGKPDHTRFGVTVRPDRQWVWLDSSERIVAPF